MVRTRGSIVGFGHDIQTIGGRGFAELLAAPDSFFTKQECLYIEGKSNPAETAAGIFAAKEAFFKALPNIEKAYWSDIEVRHDENARPRFVLGGAYREYFESHDLEAFLSISHSGQFASAVAIVVPRAAEAKS